MSIKYNWNLRLRVVALFAVLAMAWWTSSASAQTDNGFDTSGFNIETPVDSVDTQENQVVPEDTAATNASPRLTDILRSGGPLMIPIGLCSFLLVVFTFERFISLRRQRIIPGTFTRKLPAFLKPESRSGGNRPSKSNRLYWTKVNGHQIGCENTCV